MTRVVAIGGGHGLAVTLQAASTYASRLTGIVSVADDGGSSGRLRELTGLPAMGDIRRCLSALADPEIPLSGVFEHRYDGHALGNLMIAAMAQRDGSFTAAIRYFRDLLGVRADVLPATEVPVVLVAETDGGTVRGQVAVKQSLAIKRVGLEPTEPAAEPAAVVAIGEADQVVLGPGSLFTSVLAALAVPALGAAVADTGAQVVYVANLCDEAETAGLDGAAHLAALAAIGIVPDRVVAPSPQLAAAGGRSHDVARLAEALRGLA